MSIVVDFKKKYRGFTLNMRFSSPGGTLGILGASGSGKTLTLKCIAGLATPDEGHISVDGRVLYDSAAKVNLKPQQRKVGYLFQSYALFPHMTLEQNIRCVMRGGKEEKNERLQTLLERFELAGLNNNYPKQLSGGQQQRAALARILAYRPEALLLDEPFSALDTHLKEKLQAAMLPLLREYPGDAVMVTHNRDEAYRLCDNLLVLERGGALALGGTKELFADPGTAAVARLTGCKNISAARKTGPYTVYAEEWGIELRVAKEAPDGLTHIGIRAHDFHPAAGMGENCIRFGFAGRMENPFEWSVLFRNADMEGEQEIWWMYSKALGITEMPEHLRVEPESILLLCD